MIYLLFLRQHFVFHEAGHILLRSQHPEISIEDSALFVTGIGMDGDDTVMHHMADVRVVDAELNAVASAKQEYEFISSNVSKEQQELQKLQTWADLYDNCSFSAKKMLVAQFIKAVYVYRDYRIEVEFNVSFDAFREMSAQCVNRGNAHADVYEEIKENAALPKDRAASYEHNDTR